MIVHCGSRSSAIKEEKANKTDKIHHMGLNNLGQSIGICEMSIAISKVSCIHVIEKRRRSGKKGAGDPQKRRKKKPVLKQNVTRGAFFNYKNKQKHSFINKQKKNRKGAAPKRFQRLSVKEGGGVHTLSNPGRYKTAQRGH